jgi:Zn-dependent peptidase ImmA (M78 family)
MEQQISEAVNMACGYLVLTQSGEIPIDPFASIYRQDWELWKYSDIASDHRMSVFGIAKTIGSEYCATVFRDNRYIIVYNDTLSVRGLRYALAHEIGHITLGHFKGQGVIKLNFDNDTLFFTDNKKEEDEANAFAINFLCPAPLFKYFKLDDPEVIERVFDISPESAQYRVKNAYTDALTVDRYFDRSLLEIYGHNISARLSGG